MVGSSELESTSLPWESRSIGEAAGGTDGWVVPGSRLLMNKSSILESLRMVEE